MGEAHQEGEDGQQPDLTPPATRAAMRGPSPPKIHRPPDQIAGTAPTPLLTAGDKGPHRGPPPRSKTLRCEPEQRMPRRRSPRLRHGPCPAAASCSGEGERGGRGATPARGELPPRRPLGAARILKTDLPVAKPCITISINIYVFMQNKNVFNNLHTSLSQIQHMNVPASHEYKNCI